MAGVMVKLKHKQMMKRMLKLKELFVQRAWESCDARKRMQSWWIEW